MTWPLPSTRCRSAAFVTSRCCKAARRLLSSASATSSSTSPSTWRRLELPLSPAARDFIGAAPVCRIATVRANGEPHIIPVCPVFDGERTLYVDLGPQSTTAVALRTERRITVLTDEYHDDWSKLRKVILYCTAEETDAETQAAAWD